MALQLPPFAQLANDLGITPQTRRTSKRRPRYDAVAAINRHITVECRDGYLNYWLLEAVMGVAYARQTLRLSAEVENRIAALTPYRYLRLIHDIAAQQVVQGDVSRWLIRWHYGE